MGIIYHKRERIRDFYHLDPPLYFCSFESFLDIFHTDSEMTADGNGSQRIVDTEFAGKIDLHRKIHKSFRLIGNSQRAFSCNEMQIFCTKISLLTETESFQPAGMALQHFFQMFIVSIHDPHSALFEQHTLAADIVLKIFVFIRADMIRFNIGKNTQIKNKTRCPVEHQPL